MPHFLSVPILFPPGTVTGSLQISDCHAAFWAKISIVFMNYLIYIPLVSMLELRGKMRGSRRSNVFFCRWSILSPDTYM